MAALPDYVTLLFAGYGIQDSNIVLRSDVERGIPRTRRTQSDPMVTVAATMLFKSAADYQAFRTWLYSSNGAKAGAGWFDWMDPRTHTMRSGRFVMGSMGMATPLDTCYAIAAQSCAIEYVETVTL